MVVGTAGILVVVVCAGAFAVVGSSSGEPEPGTAAELSTASAVGPWFYSNQYYYEGALRHYYRGGAIREACANNDDDGVFMPKCPPHDEAAWCAKPQHTGPGTHFDAVCASACADSSMAWAMVCAWQAVANLESVCDGTFVPTPPAKSRNAPNSAWLPEIGRTSAGAKLYGCDEHAVCNSCFFGDGATSLGAETCERVAAHYGGFGTLDERSEESSGFTGAESAFFALSELDKWCEAFQDAEELRTQRRDFGFAPAWVLGFGGSDGETGEYVQRWGHVGGERVEEHVIRDVRKHQERFAQDAYDYWRYVLQADSEYDFRMSEEDSSSSKLDVTTHVHTSGASLERALREKRVAAGAVVFVDVIYATLDVQHFPGEAMDKANSFEALGWTEALDDKDTDSFVVSLKRSCSSHPEGLTYCKHRVNKECVYQFSPDLLLRSTTLRAILAYEVPLTVVVGGDLACRLENLPVTHHKLLFANDGGLKSAVQAYNARVDDHQEEGNDHQEEGNDGEGGNDGGPPRPPLLLPRASFFPFGLEGVTVLTDPLASALDADSSGARMDQWPVAAPQVTAKKFFLSVSASLNRRKPSRTTMYEWLVNGGGYDELEALRRHAATEAGQLPNSVELTDNRPPFGKKGKAILLGARALDDPADMTRRSVFSLAPAGDFWTSGRVLESMMLGSIPVVDATYETADGNSSTKGCADPAKFWRHGDEEFPVGAPFVFVERWRDLPKLLEPFANDDALLQRRLDDLQDYRRRLEDHLRDLPLALKRRLDAERFAQEQANTTTTLQVYSTCDTTPFDDADKAHILHEARAYYADRHWYEHYADSPGAPGIGCTKYPEIRDMYPEMGAACYDPACAPNLVKDFSCRFVVTDDDNAENAKDDRPPPAITTL